MLDSPAHLPADSCWVKRGQLKLLLLLVPNVDEGALTVTPKLPAAHQNKSRAPCHVQVAQRKDKQKQVRLDRVCNTVSCMYRSSTAGVGSFVCWQTITAGSEAAAADAVSTVGVSTLKFINLLAQS
jgi:hypothetical protein